MPLTSEKEYQIWMGGEWDPLGIVQENEIYLYYQMIYAQTRILECDTENFLGF